LVRVIGGSAKRHRLKVPRGDGIRPTAARVREALFNILAPVVPGSRFLDVFAGTGSVGIEALSRGAREACFIESNPRALTALKANLDRAVPGAKARVIAGDALRALRRLAAEGMPFDIIFIDPPYGKRYECRALASVAAGHLLAPSGVCIVEIGKETLPVERVDSLVLFRCEKYGDTVLTFYRYEEA